MYDSIAFSNRLPPNSISISNSLLSRLILSFHMGDTQEVQHPHQTSFTIHMEESQELQLSKIGKSAFNLSILKTKRFNYVKRGQIRSRMFA